MLKASKRPSRPQPSVNNANVNTQRPKIAVMSSFVPNQNTNPPPKLKAEYFDHIVNKACYCYIWGYDFIFNTTYAFDNTYPKWHWLDFGTWHRVPHVESRIREYDWILYTDTDFLINDIMRPLESFVHEFELYGKTNVQLFVPVDNYNTDTFTFSAFAFMIRNSPFGHTILQYWDDFARVSLILIALVACCLAPSGFVPPLERDTHTLLYLSCINRESAKMATSTSQQMERMDGWTQTSLAFGMP